MLPVFLSPNPPPRRARSLVPLAWRTRLRRATRGPLFRGGLASAVALTSGLFVWRLLGRAEAAAARYGSVTTVAVVRHDVAAGEVVAARDLRWERVPRAFLPRTRLARAPAGRTAAAALLAGEVVVEDRLAPHGVRGAAALVPAGARALAVPSGPGTPRVWRGDHVDLLAVGGENPSTSTSRVVAERAVVIETADDSVTVAVAAAEAPAVAAALARGGVTVALVGA